MPPLAPDGTGWLTTHEAASLLEVSQPTVKRLARDAGVRTEKVGSCWWLDERDVHALAAHRSRWVSFADAATLVGCSAGAIKTATRTGRIRHRQVHRALPSLEKESVLEFAHQWAAKKQRPTERATPVAGPPDDRDVWLDAATTALVMGVVDDA